MYQYTVVSNVYQEYACAVVLRTINMLACLVRVCVVVAW